MKRKIFTFLFLFLIAAVLFVAGEMTVRLLFGKRLLIQEVKGAGFYLFKPNQKGWYYSHVRQQATINNVGARGADVDLGGIHKSKKYIFLGDSFTFGWGLPDHATLPHYFQTLSPKDKVVLNYGNNAFGPRHMLGTYHFYEDIFRPGDTVVTVLIEDDLDRTRSLYQGSPWKDFFWQVKGKSAFIAWTWTASRYALELMQARVSKKSAVTPPGGEKKNPLEGEVGTLLVDFDRELAKKGQDFVLVFFEYAPTGYSNKAQAFCVQHNLKCITNVYDFIDPLKKEGKPIHTFDRMHPSAEANLAVAQGIAQFLEKESK